MTRTRSHPASGLLPLALVVLGVSAPTSFAQSTLHTFDGASKGHALGYSVSGAGDVNGDGFPDLIVGAPSDDTTGSGTGSARVLSGLDGSVIHSFFGDSVDDRFGWSVSGAGDVNGDGFDDLIVGAFTDDNTGPDSGSATVFSGLDGSVLYAFDGDAFDWLGRSVSGAGDVNGDGFSDVIVGVPRDDDVGPDKGSARVYSGRDGSILHTLYGSYSHFGWSVSGAGDVDGDLLDDVIVGNPWFCSDDAGEGPGRALVFSGRDGALLYSFDGEMDCDQFGLSVSGAGDVNGDGFADVVVGAPQDHFMHSGSARVFSGVDGSILHTLDGDSPHDDFGYSVSDAGDVDGDGFADVIVGASLDDSKGDNSGSARVFSGVDSSVLYTLEGDSEDDYFGFSVSGAGDVDRDGFDDVIVGAWADDNNGDISGSARTFSGWNSVGTGYCAPAVMNSTGLSAAIQALGREGVSDNELYLRANDMPANQAGYFLVSRTQAFIPNPGGSQGNLCLGGETGRFRYRVQDSGPSGSFVMPVDLTDLPLKLPNAVQPGETWSFQAWFLDDNPGPTSNFTDGVAVTFF